MAYLKADEIYERVRELVEDGLGSVRTAAAARFTGDLPDGLTDEEQARRGVVGARVEPRIVEVRRHPQRLVITGDVQYHLVVLEVRVVRTLATEQDVDDGLRDDVHALALQDASVLSQVLEWPGNLRQTAGGEDTDLLSLMHQRSTMPRARVTGSAGKATAIETIHRFEGTALSRPAAA